MNGLLMKAGLGTAMAATVLAAAAPAEAQRWHHRDRGADVATGALIGGAIGLGLGAAIASSNRGPGWHGGWNGAWRGGYYPPPYYNSWRSDWSWRNDWRPRCFRTWRWDPYFGGRVPVRVCR